MKVDDKGLVIFTRRRAFPNNCLFTDDVFTLLVSPPSTFVFQHPSPAPPTTSIPASELLNDSGCGRWSHLWTKYVSFRAWKMQNRLGMQSYRALQSCLALQIQARVGRQRMSNRELGFC